MKFAIKNLKSVPHNICRTTGQKLEIPPNDFIIFDTDNEREIGYWTSLKDSIRDTLGIQVITSVHELKRLEAQIKLNVSKNENSVEYTDISIVDGSISPIAKQIADSANSTTNNEPIEPDADTTETYGDKPYTEEQLLQMDKEDLALICDNFNIKYRKNSSVKTLVRLIMECDAL